jgi:hypothetical protein
MRLLIALPLLLLAACDPCPTYCQAECECAGDEAEACVDACLATMDVYSGDARTAECEERLEVLEDECR